MNKFEKTIEELKKKFPELEEVNIAILYGSVARGDFSLRHSDLDLFVILNRNEVTEKMKDKINNILEPIAAVNGVIIHIEYQGLKINYDDHTLISKMIEEGIVLYSKAFVIYPTNAIGLKEYIIYDFFSDNPTVKTRIAQILHGRKSWYYKGKDKIVKEYKGLADGANITLLGRGSLMVIRDRQKDIVSMFDRLGAKYKLIKRVYS